MIVIVIVIVIIIIMTMQFGQKKLKRSMSSLKELLKRALFSFKSQDKHFYDTTKTETLTKTKATTTTISPIGNVVQWLP